MRCPKCNFISFDDLKNCAKCSNDLSALSQQLQGTCSETRLPFFLSSVVQSPDLDQTLSGTQEFPTIDDTDINFEDTGASDFSVPVGSHDALADFADNLELAEDDLALEIGDVMPIDLDQLEDQGILEEGQDLTPSVSLESGYEDETSVIEDLDLDLGGSFSEQNEEFDVTEKLTSDDLEDDLSFDLTGDFDQEIDLDLSGDFEGMELDEDTTIATSFDDESEELLNMDDTLSGTQAISLEEDLRMTLEDDFNSQEIDGDQTEVLELDETLSNELKATKAPELDTDFGLELDTESFELQDDMLEEVEPSAPLSNEQLEEIIPELGGGEEFHPEESFAEGDIFALDDELERSIVEGGAGALGNDDLIGGFDLGESGFGNNIFEVEPDLQSSSEEDPDRLGDELLASMDDELDLDLTELDTHAGDKVGGEEFEFVNAPSLGLDEIDVSDLVSPQGENSRQGSTSTLSYDTEEELDLSSLVQDDDSEDPPNLP